MPTLNEIFFKHYSFSSLGKLESIRHYSGDPNNTHSTETPLIVEGFIVAHKSTYLT